MAVDHNPDHVMKRLMKEYKLKNDTYGEPERYLGANVGIYHLRHGSHWPMSSRDYMKEACKNAKALSQADGRKWNSKRESPMPEPCRPEMGTSGLLGDELAPRHMQFIGVLRWGAELGRVGIITEASAMPSRSCSPREGHLEALCRIFEYAQNHLSTTAVLDSSRPAFPAGKLATAG